MSMFGKRAGGGRRAAARTVGPLSAAVTTFSNSKNVELLDVSFTGARLRGKCLPESGEELFVSVGTVKAFGTVVWAEGNHCGVTFDVALQEADVETLRQSIRERKGLSLDMKAAYDLWMMGSLS
jgi:hypothetical protein